MNIRKHEFLLVGTVLLVFYILSDAFTNYLENRRLAIHNARSSFLSALTQTRVQLASHLHDLVHDPILTSNFTAKLSYSLGHSLESEIHPGTFDFFVLFDESCKPIAKTLSVPVPQGLCQKQMTDKWQWTSIDKKPMLYLLKARTHVDKPFYIGAGRYLNTSWANSFPSLKNKLHNAELKWDEHTPGKSSEFNSVVWLAGYDAKGTTYASLISQSRSFPFLRPWLVSSRPLENPFATPVLTLLLFIMIFELLKRRFSKTRMDETKKKFLKWCEKPLSGKVPNLELPWLFEAQETLVSVMTSGANRSSELSKTCDLQEKEIRRLNASLAHVERKLSEHIPHSVLSTHLASSGPTVQMMLAKFMEGSDDLESILDKGLLPVSRKMMDTLKYWQNGIATRGERHFFRSLYEQETQVEGDSLLLSEVNKLYSQAEQMNSTSMHSLSLLKKIQNEEGEAAKILENWSILASKLKDPTLKLNKICEASTALLQTTSKQRISYISKLDTDFTLNLPVPSLLGAFLMLFTAMKEGMRDAEDETLVFQMHKRSKQEHFILALSVTNDRGKILHCSPKEEMVNQVVELLKPWGMECQDIPRPEGGTYLTVKGPLSLTVDERAYCETAHDSSTISVKHEPHLV